MNLARELKKLWNNESDGPTNCNQCARNNLRRLRKETGRVGNKRMSQDHPNYSIAQISQNTENGPGDLRLAVTQTPVKDHQLTLV